MIWNWYVLTLIPVAWFLQLCLHEGSHALIGWANANRLTGFYPYPHKHMGRWFHGRVMFEMYYPMPAEFYIAPFFVSGIVLVCSVFMLFLFPVEWKLWVLPFGVAALVDALFFWYTYFFGSDLSDGKKWRKCI